MDGRKDGRDAAGDEGADWEPPLPCNRAKADNVGTGNVDVAMEDRRPSPK